jgi:hypothetical protein
VEQGQSCEGRAHTALYIDYYLYAGHRWMQQCLPWHLYRIKVIDAYCHYIAYTYYTCYSARRGLDYLPRQQHAYRLRGKHA